jgi:hypothetical protein
VAHPPSVHKTTRPTPFLALSSGKHHPTPTSYTMPSTLSVSRTTPASTYLVLRLPASPFPFTHDLLTSRISTPLPDQSVHPTPHSKTLPNSRSYAIFPSTPTFLKNDNTSSVQSTASGLAMASSMTFHMALAHLTSLVSFLLTAILPFLQSNMPNHASLR